jgi:hypothetical protein
MKVTEAIVAELSRQGVPVLGNLGFAPMTMSEAVTRAADGDVVLSRVIDIAERAPPVIDHIRHWSEPDGADRRSAGAC